MDDQIEQTVMLAFVRLWTKVDIETEASIPALVDEAIGRLAGNPDRIEAIRLELTGLGTLLQVARSRLLHAWKTGMSDPVKEAVGLAADLPNGRQRAVEVAVTQGHAQLQRIVARQTREYDRQIGQLSERLRGAIEASPAAVRPKLIKALLQVECEQRLAGAFHVHYLAGELEHANPTLASYRVKDSDGLLGTVGMPGGRLTPMSPSLRYEVLGEAESGTGRHEGGMGVVVFARDLELGRRVAIKTILPKYATNRRYAERLLREARGTARLHHPGIPAVYSLGTLADGRPFYTQRWIEGDTLQKSREGLPVPANPLKSPFDRPGLVDDPDPARTLARFLISRLASAARVLHYAHVQDVIHRDVTPSNIVLGTTVGTVVVDWGLVRSPDEQDDLGEQLGHPGYWSPEQAWGQVDRHGPHTDVFGLGATLYFLLTGRPPYGGRGARENLESLLGELMEERRINGRILPVPSSDETGTPGGSSLERMIFRRFAADPDNESSRRTIVREVRACLARRAKFPAPHQLAPGVAPSLEAICLKAMAASIEERHESAEAFAKDLDCWLAGRPNSAYPEPRSKRLARWAVARRNPIVVGGVATVLLSLALAVGFAVRDAQRVQKQADRIDDQVVSVLDLMSDAFVHDDSNWPLDSRERMIQNLMENFSRLRDHHRDSLLHALASKQLGQILARLNEPRAIDAFSDGIVAIGFITGEQARRTEAELHALKGDFFQGRRNIAEADLAYSRSIRLLDGLLDVESKEILARSYGCRGDVYLHWLGKAREAGEDYFRAHRLRRELLVLRPTDPDRWADLARSYNNLARWLAESGAANFEDALLAGRIMMSINARLGDEPRAPIAPIGEARFRYAHLAEIEDDGRLLVDLEGSVMAYPAGSKKSEEVIRDRGYFLLDLGNILLEDYRENRDLRRLDGARVALRDGREAFRKAFARSNESNVLRGQLEITIGLLACEAEYAVKLSQEPLSPDLASIERSRSLRSSDEQSLEADRVLAASQLLRLKTDENDFLLQHLQAAMKIESARFLVARGQVKPAWAELRAARAANSWGRATTLVESLADRLEIDLLEIRALQAEHRDSEAIEKARASLTWIDAQAVSLPLRLSMVRESIRLAIHDR